MPIERDDDVLHDVVNAVTTLKYRRYHVDMTIYCFHKNLILLIFFIDNI